jgi:hypothetical protein
LPVGGIVGGVVGGIIAVALITSAVWYMVTKHRRAPVRNSEWGGPETQMPHPSLAPNNQVTESVYGSPNRMTEVREMPGGALRYPDDIISANLSS